MYLKRLGVVAIVTFIVAFATGSLFDHLYKKRWSAMFFRKSDELIKGSDTYDFIFLGNSRAHFGINPYYVDSVTGLNSYNFAVSAADAEDILLTSSIYLQQHKAPKLAIISVDLNEMVNSAVLKTRFHYLFYLDNDIVNKYMQRAGFLTPLIKIFPFTKYCFFDEYNRTSVFVKGKKYPVFDHNINKGFLNLNRAINSKAAGVYNIQPDTDKLWAPSITYLKNTVSAFQRAGSRVVFVSPPERSYSRNRALAIKKITDSIFMALANEYHLKFLHFENDHLYKDGYFVNDIHLNEPGTRIYSLQLADSIKNIYPFTRQPAH